MTEPAYDLVIRGGRVATASDVFEADEPGNQFWRQALVNGSTCPAT
ncbi:MAG TPA: hypothetical protein VMM15_13460 [Bradyrhizobium sp.]|nr:hypothetical protein [Bradyrhizobium sp.]